jgi:uncharacterized protein YdeI (YjbR/CyaY-like superfamily)
MADESAKPGTKGFEEPTYFATPEELRIWFEHHASDRSELWVGFHKRDSGLPSISWPESVDEALCVGWIDGVRKRIDDKSYKIRFTPRKPTSIWSAVNLKRVPELESEGRMKPAGLAAYARRSEKRSAIYSYEQRNSAAFDPDQENQFRANAAAWEHFEKQPPWYRRAAIWHVVSAKRPETKAKRLEELITASGEGKHIEQLRRP